MAGQKRARSSTDAASGGFHTLLTNGKYYDFTLRCGDRTWKVHRAIICSQSQYFETLCDGGFREAEERVAVLEDDDPEDVDLMLQFFYDKKIIMECRDGAEPDTDDLFLGAKLYALADKYQAATFKTAVAKSFGSRLDKLRPRTRSPFMRLRELLAAVYETTPITDRGLRKPLTTYIARHKKYVLGRKSVRDYASINHGFVIDVMDILFRHLQEPFEFWFWCSICQRYQPQHNGAFCPDMHKLADCDGHSYHDRIPPPTDPFKI